MDLVRPGILLYGLHPSKDTESKMDLRPVMTLSSSVAQIRHVPAGSQISYGRTVKTHELLRLSTVPIGYADGLSRALSNNGSFVIRGREVPIVGRICMDMCMVDVTNVPDVQVGDTVMIFGAETISCGDLAERLGTSPYEVLCSVNKRIPRIYLSDGKPSEVLQYIV